MQQLCFSDIFMFTRLGQSLLRGTSFHSRFVYQTAFTSKHDYGKDDREAKWALSQRTIQGLMSGELEIRRTSSSLIAEQARRRAEIARYARLSLSLIGLGVVFFYRFYGQM